MKMESLPPRHHALELHLAERATRFRLFQETAEQLLERAADLSQSIQNRVQQVLDDCACDCSSSQKEVRHHRSSDVSTKRSAGSKTSTEHR